MSTSPDDLVTTLSRWLARHVTDEELRRQVEAADVASFSPEQSRALAELRQELERGDGPGGLEMAVRETLEALALG
jgi:hypothetical protein